MSGVSLTRSAALILLVIALVVAAQPVISHAQTPPASQYLIVPGESIGPVKLGMNITEVTQLLGTPKSTQGSSDGSVRYRWYDPSLSNYEGIGLRATRTGEVYQIWVSYDTRYTTKEGVRVGSSETEVRAALGEPSRVGDDDGDRVLSYDRSGIMFNINLDSRYIRYRQVWWIEIFAPRGQSSTVQSG